LTYYHSKPSAKPCLIPYNTLNVSVYNLATKNDCKSTFCKPLIDTITHERDLGLYLELQQQRDNLLHEFEAGGFNYILSEIIDDYPEEYVLETMHRISEIAVLSDKMRELSDNSISSILQDSVLNINQLKAWYNVVRTPIAKYLLSETHFFTGDYDVADVVLREIPHIFQFNETDMAEYNNYMRFHNLRKQVHFSERSWADLTDEEIVRLQSIAEANTGRSSTMAKGILCFFYDICYDQEYEIIDDKSGKSPFIFAPELEHKQNEPNEILHAIVDDFLVVNTDKVSKIDIYNMTGRVVSSVSGKNHVAIGHLPKGIYIVKIISDDFGVYIDKLIKP